VVEVVTQARDLVLQGGDALGVRAYDLFERGDALGVRAYDLFERGDALRQARLERVDPGVQTLRGAATASSTAVIWDSTRSSTTPKPRIASAVEGALRAPVVR
jgi:hypothetical protein